MKKKWELGKIQKVRSILHKGLRTLRLISWTKSSPQNFLLENEIKKWEKKYLLNFRHTPPSAAIVETFRNVFMSFIFFCCHRFSKNPLSHSLTHSSSTRQAVFMIFLILFYRQDAVANEFYYIMPYSTRHDGNFLIFTKKMHTIFFLFKNHMHE